MQLSIPGFPKLALLLSVSGLAVGLLMSFLFTPIYVSRADMRYEEAFVDPAHPRGDRALREYLLRAEKQVLSRSSLKRIIQDARLDLYPEERRTTPLEDVIEGMRTKAIRISLNPPASGAKSLSFEVSFACRDRVKSQQTVQALITRFEDANLISQGLPTNLDVTSPPTRPIQAERPDRLRFMAVGFATGLAAAIVIAIFRRKRPPIPFPAQLA